MASKESRRPGRGSHIATRFQPPGEQLQNNAVTLPPQYPTEDCWIIKSYYLHTILTMNLVFHSVCILDDFVIYAGNDLNMMMMICMLKIILC
jgi:hypothetical protein